MKKTGLVLFLALFFFGYSAAAENTQLFTVEADAVVRVRPEKAVLNVGAISKGKSLAETKKKNADIIKKAVDFCVKSGIPGKNIQTDYISIRPEFKNYETSETYFYVEQSLMITLDDLSQYDAVLTELLNLGINQVRNVVFQVNDLKHYKNESRKLAIEAAKERAEFLAKESGIKLGEIVNLTDVSKSMFPYGRYGGSMMSNVSQNIVQNAGVDEVSSETLAPGMISVRSNIVLTYEIKKK